MTRVVKLHWDHGQPADPVLHQAPPSLDFASAARAVAALEAFAGRLNEIDRLQLGRLMISSGHAVTLTCRSTVAK
jgi:hypothetical protein